LYEALGVAPPRYAHLPLIFNPDGSKMSKRDKAKIAREAGRKWLAGKPGGESKLAEAAGLSPSELSEFLQKRSDDAQTAAAVAQVAGVHLPEIDIHDFRLSGYLPEALVNYLALLGWSPKDDAAEVNAETLAKLFDMSGIGRSPARFDRVKLLAFDADAIQRLPPAEFRVRLRQYFAEFYPAYLELLGPVEFDLFADSYRERSHTLADPADKGSFFIAADENLSYDPVAVRKTLLAHDAEGLRMLRELLPHLHRVAVWSAATLEETFNGMVQALGVGLGKIGQPLRVAISGGTVTPPLFDTLAILGKERVINRIEACLRRVEVGVT
jgi:glutamyl-tRNA synthetase